MFLIWCMRIYMRMDYWTEFTILGKKYWWISAYKKVVWSHKTKRVNSYYTYNGSILLVWGYASATRGRVHMRIHRWQIFIFLHMSLKKQNSVNTSTRFVYEKHWSFFPLLVWINNTSWHYFFMISFVFYINRKCYLS